MNVLQIVPDWRDHDRNLVSEAEVAESLTKILDVIAGLQELTAGHAELCTMDESSKFENEEALRWIGRALDDLAATAVGITRSVA